MESYSWWFYLCFLDSFEIWNLHTGHEMVLDTVANAPKFNVVGINIQDLVTNQNSSSSVHSTFMDCVIK